MDGMTNAAAIGYMILAAKDLKLDKEVIRQLESNIKYFMDMRSEEEAEEVYNKFYQGGQTMNYLEIDYSEVTGYKKLSEPAKAVFERVYKSHNAGQGLDYKEAWKPVKVKEHKTYLEVHFKNGEWLHYLPNGSWY